MILIQNSICTGDYHAQIHHLRYPRGHHLWDGIMLANLNDELRLIKYYTKLGGLWRLAFVYNLSIAIFQ